MSIQLKGNDDDTILNNYKVVQNDFAIPGVDVKLAGLQPLANELMGTIAEDQQRAEVLAVPLVAVVLFFVSAVWSRHACRRWSAPVHRRLTGHHAVGRDIRAGALLRAAGGDADRSGHRIDYGLFVVSRFREEIAEGTTPKPRYAAR
jgi:Predicted drug exporters of the RND superfamily